jgi:hypothetical protein
MFIFDFNPVATRVEIVFSVRECPGFDFFFARFADFLGKLCG